MHANQRQSIFAVAGCVAASLATAPTLAAYDVDAGWPNGTIPMELMLDSSKHKPAIPTAGLIDGGTNWNSAVEPGFGEWNAKMERTQFTFSTATDEEGKSGNGRNELFFAEDVYGEPFGEGVLAVAYSRRTGLRGLRITEADVLFNKAVQWNSYRGNTRTSMDIRRVALHELGHVIGLNHPDEAIPAQSVQAIMNSRVSSVDALRDDDIAGADFVYYSGLVQPTFATQPQGATLTEGTGAGVLSFEVSRQTMPAKLTGFSWALQPPSGNIELLITEDAPSLPLGAAQLDDAGAYFGVIETPLGESPSSAAQVTVTPTVQSGVTRLMNLSTRGVVGTGDRVLIVGFAISEGEPRRILLRGVGPTLSSLFGVTDTVADPALNLKNSSGTTVASNDDWHTGGPAEMQAAFDQAGAFYLDANSTDAALVITLDPGVYTALLSTKTGVEAVGLVEVYDLDSASTGTSRLTNLSTRGFVDRGDKVLIGGFTVSGPAPRKYLLRAVGDTLVEQGVQEGNTLDDPTLRLFRQVDSKFLRYADDWDAPEFLQTKIAEATTTVGGFPLSERQESAMLLTLEPGGYTVHLRGFEDATGLALVEIYEFPHQE